MGDELRRLLDGLGARHMDVGDMTLWLDRDGNRWCATEQPDGLLHVQSIDMLTPREALASTLGREASGNADA